MKIALVIPTKSYAYSYPTYLGLSDFPVGFAYLAAALKKAGHEVIGINPNNDPQFTSAKELLVARLTAALREHRPDLIGIGGLCTDFAFLRDSIELIRKVQPGTPIVCGGGIITHDAENAFPLLHPDFAILGEAEETFIQLVGHLEQGLPVLGIPNLGFWESGQIRFTPASHAYPNLDSRAFPDYEPFDPESMLVNNTYATRFLYRYSRAHPRIVPIVAARGCPFRCTFCIHQHGPKYRIRSVENVLAEIGELHERYHFNILMILDELFAVNRAWLKQFCDGIREGREKHGWDFDWAFQTHANSALTLEELRLLKEAGCYYFSYGMESASPTVLKSMNKRTRPEQIAEAMRLAGEVKIGFGGNFIFGDIAETPATITETMDFFTDHCLDHHVFLAYISPYPGSQLFTHCRQQGIVRDLGQYYQTIDTRVSNMTSAPNGQWEAWVQGFVWPLESMPFLLETETTEASPEAPLPDPAIDVRIWQVRATCPHCLAAMLSREPVKKGHPATESFTFVTGCPACGKRFRIRVAQAPSAAVPHRPVSAEALKEATRQSLSVLTTPRSKVNILYIALEFGKWQRARSWSYQMGLGLEEGFSANNLSFLTLPIFEELAAGDSGTWLSHLREICAGKTFDQVWIEGVHLPLDDALLAYIVTLAPIRVALLGESLVYLEEVYAHAPQLRQRRALVEHRLRYMTHVLAGDEADALRIQENGIAQAMWWVQALPTHAIRTPSGPPSLPFACFTGAIYGDRETWLTQPALQGLLQKQPPMEDATEYPALFNQVNELVVQAQRQAQAFQPTILQTHVEALRKIRRQNFSLWIDDLARGQAVVNIPSFIQGYPGRVFEGMAAGRPVISYEIPDRPRTKTLFTEGAEILLYPKDAPEALAGHLHWIMENPAKAEEMASRARTNLLKHHTLGVRIAQIRQWIRTGQEPHYR